jgi:predicted dehydrogenase
MTVTYRVSAGALPVSHWAHDLEQGGGRVLGEVCHFVDTLAFLAGSPVREVHATGFSDLDLPTQARDNVAVTLRHVDGSIGTIAYVAHSAPGIGKERIEAFASAGIGVLDDYLTLELHGEQSVLSKGRAQNKGHREEIAAFLDGVRSGRPPVALPELTNVSLATLGVVESMRTGAPVAIDPS